MAGGETPDPGVTSPPAHRSLLGRWQLRDPGLRATKRSIRAAVLVPALFALTDFGIGNAQTTLFSVFGAFALLLFADFGGPTRVRLRSYIGLFAAGIVLITAGTLCSTRAAPAIIGMAVFGFAVLFAGALGPQAAVGATAALLTFVLPVAVPVGASAVGSRLAGWALAGAVCIPAALLVWSDRWHDPLRRSLAGAARAVAELVEAHADGRLDPAARDRADADLHQLRAQYEATPYRPTGAGPTDHALVNLVSRMEWVGKNALIPPEARSTLSADGPGATLLASIARVLRQIADLVDRDDGPTATEVLDGLADDVDQMTAARRASRDAAWHHLLADRRSETGLAAAGDGSDEQSLWSVDPTYPVRMLAVATEMTAEVALGSVPRGPGSGGPTGFRAPLADWLRAARVHLTSRSVWFRNSLRGATALALAVAVVEATDVRHGFWVVLGTMSVLRSNALGTGANALRAVAGTVVGFAVGSLILVALGHHLTLLWAVLPLAVLVAGVAPSAISFAAGQAGFTVAVVIIFNILDPVGTELGLVRVEDVAIGVGVSTVVGLLFWPRGAGAELARALSEAYAGALAWLVAEIGMAASSSGRDGATARRAAEGAAYRLDDAFRQFLAERGAKPVALPEITGLVTGSAEVRLVARTLAALPEAPLAPDEPSAPAIREAGREVTQEFAARERWFDSCTEAFGKRPVRVPDVAPIRGSLRSTLLAAVDGARRSGRTGGLIAALRLLWLSERLGEVRRMQTALAQVGGERRR